MIFNKSFIAGTLFAESYTETFSRRLSDRKSDSQRLMLISITLTLEPEGRQSMRGLNSHKGFTLIELMIALAAASIVTTGIYGFYHVQQKSHVTQQLVVEMQQNIRATMSLMKREIRMAGYDPAATDGIDNDVPPNGIIDEPAESAGSGILTAANDMIQFSWDMDGNGAIDNTGTGEGITYSFEVADDANGDGIADSGASPLGRDPGAAAFNLVPMADDIQAVGFAYAFDDDADGLLDTSVNGNVIWAFDANGVGALDTILDTNDDGLIDTADTPGGSALASTVNLNNIRAVRVWLLGRTRSPVRDYHDNMTYVVGDRRVNPLGDNFQRRLLVETIHCRNMGL